ncbi:MAG: HAMP domain-containing protein [Myxococcales bacterium]|nr:HAMP domain-containing protein [Myxococcales bacterium]
MNLRARLVLALWLCVLVPVSGVALGAWWLLARPGAHTTIPAHQAFEPMMLTVIGALLLGGAVATALAVFLAPAVAKPIRAAMEAADRIAAGTRSVQIDTEAGGEAGRLVQAFNRMARELDAAESRLRRAERLAAWRDIARQMAHEIKNPLTPIQMAVELLRKAKARDLEGFDELFDEQTMIVLEEVARLRRLVENFSRFARAPKPMPNPMEVSALVEHVVSMHAHGEAEVTGEAESSLPSIRADREQLTQVLVNLVQNAVFASAQRASRAPRKGPAAVHVSAKRDGARVVISVEDNGAGIDPSVRDQLFEPYVTTKKGQGGTGLGLAIAWRIVHEHDGALTVETSPEGTRFDITLPIAGPTRSESNTTTIERHA